MSTKLGEDSREAILLDLGLVKPLRVEDFEDGIALKGRKRWDGSSINNNSEC